MQMKMKVLCIKKNVIMNNVNLKNFCRIEKNEFTNQLIIVFGYLMETFFSNWNSYIHIRYTLLLSNIFSILKKNLILVYSLLQSCISQNITKIIL